VTFSRSVTLQYSFWLTYIWENCRFVLLALALFQILLLARLRPARGFSVPVVSAALSVLLSWLLSATTLWIAVTVPEINQLGVNVGMAILVASVCVGFAGGIGIHWKLSRWKSAV
jgi:hypothetical protein